MKNLLLNLRTLTANEINTNAAKDIAELATFTDVKDILDKWYFKNLMTRSALSKKWEIKDLADYLAARIYKQTEKKMEDKNKRFETVGTAEKIITNITISVEWTKNRTWGNCPKAEVRVCFTDNTCDNYESARITGCGYDKESTAIAQALNQCNELLNLMYALKDANHEKKNNDIFGYGSGYGINPYFEGGVGTSCYPKIFDVLGFNMQHLSGGKTFDTWQVNAK